MLKPRTCKHCGKTFTPFSVDDWGCSPTCRVFIMTKEKNLEKKKREEKLKEKLDAISRIPHFDLKENPRARAEWFVALPKQYKDKFARFLTPQDQKFALEIGKKEMSEESIFSGYFVKKGKIVEVKSAPEEPDYESQDELIFDDQIDD